jgi:hypothetical protein
LSAGSGAGGRRPCSSAPQDPELLGFIDEVFGHGLFRNWVHFTKSFQQVFPHASLDQDKARAVFALFGGVSVH